MPHRIHPLPRPLASGVSIALAGLAALGCPVAAQAADECGMATTGRVVCQAGDTPYSGIHYQAADDFELLLEAGVVVDGALADPNTAVTVYGHGDVNVSAADGTEIRNSVFPAIDVASSDGAVSVALDRVFGGSVGVAAVAHGDVALRANHVEGDIAVQAESVAGDIDIDIGFAMGRNGGAGVFATAADGNVRIRADELRAEGDFTQAVYGFAWKGNLSIDVGSASMMGLGGEAIRGDVDVGDLLIDAGIAYAEGDGTGGIIAAVGLGDAAVRVGYASATGNESVGVAVYAMNGEVLLSADSISADGDVSRAIDIGALDAVTLRADTVIVDGNDSAAAVIETVGDVDVRIGRMALSGDNTRGLGVLTSGDVNAVIGELVAFHDNNAGLDLMTSGSAHVSIGKAMSHSGVGESSLVRIHTHEGNAGVEVVDSAVSNSSHALDLFSDLGRSHAIVAQGARVSGKLASIRTHSALGSRIDIAGIVESSEEAAIQARGSDSGKGAADIRVGKTGAILGRLDLSAGNDTVSNAGRIVAAGTSDFGAGDDRLANQGRLALADGLQDTLVLRGLERLDNSGLISLVNQRVGDTLRIDGAIHGSRGSALAIDVDIADGRSDTIEVGDLAGDNTLDINIVGRGSGLGLRGLRVLSSAGRDTGAELRLAESSRNRGFIGFQVRYDGHDSWYLDSDLNDAGYLAAALPAGVRSLWRQGADSVSAHLLASEADESRPGLWVQAMGSDIEGDASLSHELGARDLTWKARHDGVQIGAEAAAGAWRAGVTLAHADARIGLGGHESSRFDMLSVGLYGAFRQHGWYANAMLRADFIDLQSRWQSIGLEDEGEGTTLGASVEGGYRFDLGAVWFEPMMRLAWVNIELPEQNGRYGDVLWHDNTTGSLELGLRLGAARGWLQQRLRPYLAMSYVREFGDDYQTFYDLGTEELLVSDASETAHGRIAAGTRYAFGRTEFYIEGEHRFGDVESTGARLGARVRF